MCVCVSICLIVTSNRTVNSPFLSLPPLTSRQGPFYCGVGAESVYGRPLAEAHMEACMKAGLNISGINAEVMPGQWEYQIGPVGALELGDETHLSRWLLHRLGEDFGIVCTFHPKPVKQGDWWVRRHPLAPPSSVFSVLCMHGSGARGASASLPACMPTCFHSPLLSPSHDMS